MWHYISIVLLVFLLLINIWLLSLLILCYFGNLLHNNLQQLTHVRFSTHPLTHSRVMSLVLVNPSSNGLMWDTPTIASQIVIAPIAISNRHKRVLPKILEVMKWWDFTTTSPCLILNIPLIASNRHKRALTENPWCSGLVEV